MMTTIDNKWLVSDWDAGQSYLTRWDPTNVVTKSNGSIQLILDRAVSGQARPYDGAEFQSLAAATTGTWTWMAKAPDMVDGAVFGMFLYQDDYRTQPWREYDIEFVGENTRQIRLAVHFVDAAGKHVTLKTPSIIELGFDASTSMHLYGITVSMTSVSFTVDGVVVETFNAADIQSGIWDPGPLNSVTDLWVAPPQLAPWAGDWVDPGRPLVATVDAFSLPGDSAFIGKAQADSLKGTSGVDQLYGNAGNDALDGKGGADVAFGGSGNDTYWVDNAKDETWEYAGQGSDVVKAWVNWTLARDTEKLVLQGSAALSGTGNDLANTMTGNSAANRLSGVNGNDTLVGGAGADTLRGDAGNDLVNGGTGNDLLTGGAGNDSFLFRAGDGKDRITDFRAGGSEDRLQIDDYKSYKLQQSGADTLVVLSSTDSILLTNVTASHLTASDFLFV